MGLFGTTKHKTYVGTTVMRVIEDNMLPNSVKLGALTAIIKNQNITDTVMEELFRSVASKGRNYYNYGKNHYSNGVPLGYPVTSVIGAAEVESVLENEIEMAEVVMSYSFFGRLNYYHLANRRILEDYGYDVGTEELPVLTTLKGFTVILDYVSLVMSTAMFNVMSEEALHNLEGDTRLRIDEGVTTIGLEITYSWTEVVPDHPNPDILIPHTETLSVTTDLSVVGYDSTADYFHAQYVVGGLTKYFEYKKGAGTYATLDGLFDTPPIEAGSYFPWMHLRSNFTSITADVESEEYLTTKKLGKRIGIDIDSLSTAINTNENIGDVIQAIFMLAVPPNSTNSLELKYLYEYFDNMFLGLGGKVTALDAATLNASLSLNDLVATAIVIEDAKFKMSLSNSGVYRRLVTGSIGAVGTYGSLIDDFTLITIPITEDGISFTYMSKTVVYHLYRKQVNETQYEEIQIMDLSCNYRVIGGYYTTGDGDLNVETMLIPLDLAIVNQFSFKDKETLYSRAMHLVFNSMVVVKVKWYQQGWFKFIVTVIAIAITVKSLGTLGSIGKGLLALVTLDITYAGLVILLLDILGVILLPLLFKAFVKEVGIDNALIVTLFLLVRGGYQVFAAETLKTGLATAEDLLKMVTGLVKAIQEVQIDMVKDIQDSLTSFNEEARKAFELLEDVADKLDNSVVLSPLTILGESAHDYYQRTRYTGNVATLSYETVSKYVKTMLTLPEFDGFFESKENGTT